MPTSFDDFICNWLEDANALTKEEKLQIVDGSLLSFEHKKEIAAKDSHREREREEKRLREIADNPQKRRQEEERLAKAEKDRQNDPEEQLYQRFIKLHSELRENEKPKEEAQAETEEEVKADEEPEDDSGAPDELDETKAGGSVPPAEDEGEAEAGEAQAPEGENGTAEAEAQ